MRPSENPVFDIAMRDRALRGAARDVYVWMNDALTAGEFRAVKHTGIEAAIGISDTQVASAIAMLIASGYLERGLRDGRLSTYRLITDPALLPAKPEHPTRRRMRKPIHCDQTQTSRGNMKKRHVVTVEPGSLDRREYESLRSRIICGTLAGAIDNEGSIILPRESMEQLKRENDEEARRQWAAHDRAAALMGMAEPIKMIPAEIANKHREKVVNTSAAMTFASVGPRPADPADAAGDLARSARASRTFALLGAAEMPARTDEEAEAEREKVLRASIRSDQ
jgi:hypothetical protein